MPAVKHLLKPLGSKWGIGLIGFLLVIGLGTFLVQAVQRTRTAALRTNDI